MYTLSAKRSIPAAAMLASTIAITFGAPMSLAAPSAQDAKSNAHATTRPKEKKAASTEAESKDKKSSSTKEVANNKSSPASNKSSQANNKSSPASKDGASKTAKIPEAKVAPSAPMTNLSGTWNIKFHEGASPKTHIMAVKVTHKGSSLTATGVDNYGDVILDGTVSAPNKISFKRTYKGEQANPAAQYEGTFTPATALTPVTAKGTWSAQPFADKNQKPKASANSGDWDAHIFTGPAINK